MQKRLFLLLIFCSSCSSPLYVRHERVDKSYLASTHIGTPDPRLKNPPEGQRIVVNWDLPKSIFEKELTLHLVVRFWNQSEKEIDLPLQKKRGNKSFYFPSKEKDRQKKILTYKAEIVAKSGEVIEHWKHHFWTKKIDIDPQKE